MQNIHGPKTGTHSKSQCVAVLIFCGQLGMSKSGYFFCSPKQVGQTAEGKPH